ncbi:MAG: hypothetical protein NTX04_13490 [Verrucomicrobia bacterium]|nr:hypothetical protein [Verrucomicrobiota bacterium]
MFRLSRFEILLFLTIFFSFAYFHQGGGWNQNARFAEIRAITEEGRFAIDHFLVYLRVDSSDQLQRVPLSHANYQINDETHALYWADSLTQIPVDPLFSPQSSAEEPLHGVAASGDVSYVQKTGHFHPNKPPGTSFLALPAYWTIFHIEHALGINPDQWWILNLNLWLTTVFSVGIFSAAGCVLFFRIAVDLTDGQKFPALLATFSLAFATTFFPFGTILFDHNLTAALLIASFYFLRPKTSYPFLAGFTVAFAVVTNYVAAGAVVALGLYSLFAHSPWQWRRTLWFALGGLAPALLLAWFHFVNFGSPFALNNDFQNPLFKDPNGSLGMFSLPSQYVASLLAFSPYRGVFWLSPVLLLGLFGWLVWLRKNILTAETLLSIAICAWFFLVNTSFNGYHAGFSAGPRYLIPALPFLALPLVVSFTRFPKFSSLLFLVSFSQQFLLTATDAQNSLAVGGHARVDDAHRKDDFYCNIVTEYAAPLFFTGKVGPLLEQLLTLRLEADEKELSSSISDPEQLTLEVKQLRHEYRAAVDRGDRDPLLLATLQGPVSVNTVSTFEGQLGYGLWPTHSTQSAWASFNLGEFLWPQSLWSLLPLFLIIGALSTSLIVASLRNSP